MLETVSRAEAEALVRGPLDSILSPSEGRAFAALSTPKRRADWLGARLAAKRLVRRLLGADAPAHASIEIVSRPSGRPVVRLPGRPEGTPALSLSHCEEGGLAAAAPAGLVGADWETVRPLDARARALFAHPSEGAATLESAALIALWTVKEAVLKLLGLGLGAGLQDVRRLPGGALSLHGEPSSRWRRLGAPPISLEQRAVGAAVLTIARMGGS